MEDALIISDIVDLNKTPYTIRFTFEDGSVREEKDISEERVYQLIWTTWRIFPKAGVHISCMR
jgi:hypothetical protein